MNEEKNNKLNPKQKLFCKLYATKETFFCNGTRAYIEVYNPKRNGSWYKTARTNASRLLTNANICEYINNLLEEQGINNGFVDKQLLFLITQHTDLSAKMRAIQEYNRIKGRISEKKEIQGKVIVMDD